MPVALAVSLLAIPDHSFAQQPAAAPTQSHISFSGYMQPQYEFVTSDGETEDRAFFRRLFVTLDASTAKDWSAEVQADLGRVASGGDRIVIKNAYVQYGGWRERGITLTLGNQKPPFSRSLITSSSKRSFVERPFTGDRAFGSPGRMIGLKAEGWHRERSIYWSGMAGITRHSPDAGEVRLDGAAEGGQGWAEGPMVVARIELHPLGEVARDHGDFNRGPLRVTVGAAAYGWWNDDDAEPHGGEAVDAASVGAVELSGGLRGSGLTIEAEVERVTGDAIEAGVTHGLYLDGHLRLNKASLESGCMVLRERLELLGGADLLSTDAFDTSWHRLSAGMNVYLNRHALKFSLMHRESFNEGGVEGARSRATYIQTQFAF